MTDQPFDLNDLEVVLFAEGAPETADLRRASSWGGRVWLATAFSDALEALASREIAALVVQTPSSARTLELLDQAGEVAPDIIRVAAAPQTDALLLVGALNNGRIDRWVPSPATGDDLGQALKTALIRQAAQAASRDLVELLRRRHETSERVIDALQEEAQELRRRLARLAPTDRVTGLYNRRHLVDHWRRECARARRYGLELSLVLLEPTAERELSGEELRRIGSFLVLAIRDVDLAGRFDEGRFAVILPHCGPGNAVALSRRLVASFSEHVDADETMWDSGPWSSVSDPGQNIASVQLVAAAATLGPDGGEPDEVLTAAERALALALKG